MELPERSVSSVLVLGAAQSYDLLRKRLVRHVRSDIGKSRLEVYSQVHRTLNLTHAQQDAGYVPAALELTEQPRHFFRLPLLASGPRLFKQSAQPVTASHNG